MYWLTGYDTFGFCFFQSLVVKADGSMTLLTRSADLRQARHTSILENIVLWTDRDNANPTVDLRNLLNDLGPARRPHRCRIRHPRPDRLSTAAASMTTPDLRPDRPMPPASSAACAFSRARPRSPRRKAASLADDALDAAMPLIESKAATRPMILAAMQGAIFAGGGDYPANEFIIGSGVDALLCRYKAGRRKLNKNDQLTLEWAGVFAHYHAPMMRTIV
jgi:Xaa-Pro dipeptidase